jgi:hypothetical protein
MIVFNGLAASLVGVTAIGQVDSLELFSKSLTELALKFDLRVEALVGSISSLFSLLIDLDESNVSLVKFCYKIFVKSNGVAVGNILVYLKGRYLNSDS